MVNTEAAAQLAQRCISRALSRRPAAATADLPFDPHDAEDVHMWARHEILGRRWPPSTTHSYMATRLELDARKAVHRAGLRARNGLARSHRHHQSGRFIVRARGRIPIPADQPDTTADAEWIEVLVVAAACAAATMQIRTPGGSARPRFARATLPCLLRLGHAVTDVFDDRTAFLFREGLVLHPGYRALSISTDQRLTFEESLSSLRHTGSVRRDLSAVGWEPPANARWDQFISLIQVEIENSLGHSIT